MSLQATPYTIPLVLATLLAGALFILAATQRSRTGAMTMMGLFGAMALYSGGYALQLASTTLPAKLFWHAVRFAGPALVTVAFFIFALQYAVRGSRVTPVTVLLLLLVPVTTLVLVWTDVYGLHDLVLGNVSVAERGGLIRLVATDGPWYTIHALYSLVLTFVAVGLFGRNAWRETGSERTRSVLFALAGLIAVSGGLVYFAGLTAIDWGPITYAVTGVLLVVAIFLA